nr:MAG TPA: hypothetical protein [Caudoviricetes sp.]
MRSLSKTILSHRRVYSKWQIRQINPEKFS